MVSTASAAPRDQTQKSLKDGETVVKVSKSSQWKYAVNRIKMYTHTKRMNKLLDDNATCNICIQSLTLRRL